MAIIMDGNRRWAQEKGLPSVMGHRAGIETLKQIIQRGAELGVEYITLYTFSSENWLREKGWLDEFMGLLRMQLKSQLKDLMKNGVRIRTIGNLSLFDNDIQEMIRHMEEATQNNTKITAILALSYSGRDEIVRACQAIAGKVKQGLMSENDITADIMSQHLDTKNIPNPDLLIRTGNEQRISNFLVWQAAYSEFVFSKELWPDFKPIHFDEAINIYSKRTRRYGL